MGAPPSRDTAPEVQKPTELNSENVEPLPLRELYAFRTVEIGIRKNFRRRRIRENSETTAIQPGFDMKRQLQTFRRHVGSLRGVHERQNLFGKRFLI